MKVKVEKPEHPHRVYEYVAKWFTIQEVDQFGNKMLDGNIKCEATYDTYEEAEKRCLAEMEKNPQRSRRLWCVDEQYFLYVELYSDDLPDYYRARCWNAGVLQSDNEPCDNEMNEPYGDELADSTWDDDEEIEF
jgi:hypothetical protein